jgi:hypothetical protein
MNKLRSDASKGHMAIGPTLQVTCQGRCLQVRRTAEGESLSAPTSHLVLKEEQTGMYHRFLAQAASPVARVGRHLAPQPGLEVMN